MGLSPRLAATAALVALLVGLLAAPAVAAEGPVNTSPPVVNGDPVYSAKLVAGAGTWQPAAVTLAHQWLRDGRPISGAVDRAYRPGLKDLGRRLSVRVTATDASGSTAATSAETTPVERARLTRKKRPRVVGVARFTRTVRATPGRWSPRPTRVRYQWLRGGRPIAGATSARYTFAPQDVGQRIRVRVLVKAPGHRPATRLSRRADPVKHRVDVRRSVTYSIATRGRVRAGLAKFRAQAAETYADARGWRGAGVQFRRVRRGGSFTLVLASASAVPTFSPVCSSMWSCRVGRYVIINQDRWLRASPAWNAGGRSLRDYRHMVVNHETGHWLGHGHASCPRPGRLAPVMMQQSKGTGGCKFNPWPTLAELTRR